MFHCVSTCTYKGRGLLSMTNHRHGQFDWQQSLILHNQDQTVHNKNQRRTNTWSRIKETQLQLLNAGRTAGKTSGIVSMCKLQRPLVAFGKNTLRDHDIITCVNEINNSRPRDLNLLFTNKTSGREEDSSWDTFESQDVDVTVSLSLRTLSLTVSLSLRTHTVWGLRTLTVSLSLRTHTFSLTLRTHTVSLSLRTHTVSEDTHCLTVSLSLRTHIVSLTLRTHTVSLSLRTHTVSLTLRTHTVSEDTLTEDTHCLWGHTLRWHWLWEHTVSLTVSEDTHCLTVSEDTHCLTVSEDTHWLWGHTLSHSLRTHTALI